MTELASASAYDRSIDFRSLAKQPVVAVMAVALTLLVPLLATIVVGTFTVNLIAGVTLIAAAFTLGLPLASRWLHNPARQAVGGMLVFLGILFAAWEWQVGDLWLNSQLILYCGIAVALPAFTAWFRESGTNGAQLILELKLGTVVGSSLIMLNAVRILPDDLGALRGLTLDPPVYGNVRHFNYDQLVAIAIAIYFASQVRTGRSRLTWFLLLVGMGFLLAWSGGRGVLLCLGVYLALVWAFQVLPRRAIVTGCGALALGTLLVIITGQGDLFFRLFFKWSGSLNDISSNRLEIWLSSLGVWREHLLSVVFGFGPDAMRTTVRARIGFPPVVQAHDGFVQMLIEFGLVGLCVFVAAVWVIARRALNILMSCTVPTEARVAAALLMAYGAYMLIDGIIYHAIPLIMVMLLTAYLFSLDPVSADSGGATAKASAIPGR